MGLSFIISLVLHGLLIGALLIEVHEKPIITPTIMQVTVTAAPPAELSSEPPTPPEAPAPEPPPIPQPPPPDLAVLAPDTTPPEVTVPQERPAEPLPEIPPPPTEPPAPAEPAPPAPEPPPILPPEPETPDALPPPEPEPVPEPEPTPEPEPEPAPEPEPEPAITDVTALLDDIARGTPEQNNQETPEEVDEDAVQTNDISTLIDELVPAAQTVPDQRNQLTSLDALRIRDTLRPCWQVAPNMRQSGIIIEITVTMNRDGTVRSARVSGGRGGTGTPQFRAAQDAALRAVRNPACQPWPLQAENYAAWRQMILEFNPVDMQ
ncbi:MAG: cell envelope integrity protein TolA [Pseudomonadota bacterium]